MVALKLRNRVRNMTVGSLHNRVHNSRRNRKIWAFVQKPEMALSVELIRARNNANLTTAQVAARMETELAVVVEMESGKSWPTMSDVRKYADAVGARPFLNLRVVRDPREKGPKTMTKVGD